jgi:hypothetical protein
MGVTSGCRMAICRLNGSPTGELAGELGSQSHKIAGAVMGRGVVSPNAPPARAALNRNSSGPLHRGRRAPRVTFTGCPAPSDRLGDRVSGELRLERPRETHPECAG